MMLLTDDNVDDDVDNKNDAKKENDRLKKRKDHVSILASIELNDSWCDASLHH
jgi:hypothetical protein